MTTRMNFTQLTIRAAAGSVTGSIQRVCAADESNASTIDNWVTGNFKSFTYSDGNAAAHTGSQNDAGTTSNDDLTVAANSCIDGPFIAIHADADDVLIYHNGIYNTVAD